MIHRSIVIVGHDNGDIVYSSLARMYDVPTVVVYPNEKSRIVYGSRRRALVGVIGVYLCDIGLDAVSKTAETRAHTRVFLSHKHTCVSRTRVVGKRIFLHFFFFR